MSTLRGCPPRWVCGGGISGAKIPHCASVRSEGYRFRDRPSVAKCVYSFTGEACVNCLPNQAFCQGRFPESLLDVGKEDETPLLWYIPPQTRTYGNKDVTRSARSRKRPGLPCRSAIHTDSGFWR